jgi:hypothetical protein
MQREELFRQILTDTQHSFCADMRVSLLNLILLRAAAAAHQDENARAIWSHLLRCDMRNDKGDQWLSPTLPAYTIGTWNPSTSGGYP